MDSLSQIALGAAVGYAVAGKDLGKKAFILGGIAGTLPDLDFIFAMSAKDDFRYLTIHRGFSHSIIGSITLPYLWTKATQFFRKALPTKPLYALYFWGALTHLALDAFTSWGTQIFWPLANRIALNSIFIIDPLYTLLLGTPLILAMRHQSPKKLVWIGIIASTTYLLMSLAIKQTINTQFEAVFKTKNIPVTRYITRPTPFNTILWSVTAETDTHYHIGYISLLDKAQETTLYALPKTQEIPPEFQNKKTQKLLTWTKNFYTTTPTPKGLTINDLRYGTLGDPRQVPLQYVFRYHLTPTKTDTPQILIQNPNDTDPKQLLTALLSRLKGI